VNLRLSWRKNQPDLDALFRQGFPSFVFGRNPEGLPDGIPVFCYHAADPETVEADLYFLKENGYQSWSIAELMRHLREGIHPKNRTVVLTVDDGACDLYSVMYPALKRYGFHAVAFVAPAFHRDAHDGPDHARPCTWDELREMERSGHVDVQAHTWSHRYIPNWPEPLDLVGIDSRYLHAIQRSDAGTVRDDLARAKQELESQLNKRVAHLAFPMYRGTDSAVRTGRELGYASFWWGTLPRRRANKPGDSPERIVRISAEFIRRLPGEGRVALHRIGAGRIACAWRRKPKV